MRVEGDLEPYADVGLATIEEWLKVNAAESGDSKPEWKAMEAKLKGKQGRAFLRTLAGCVRRTGDAESLRMLNAVSVAWRRSARRGGVDGTIVGGVPALRRPGGPRVLTQSGSHPGADGPLLELAGRAWATREAARAVAVAAEMIQRHASAELTEEFWAAKEWYGRHPWVVLDEGGGSSTARRGTPGIASRAREALYRQAMGKVDAEELDPVDLKRFGREIELASVWGHLREKLPVGMLALLPCDPEFTTFCERGGMVRVIPALVDALQTFRPAACRAARAIGEWTDSYMAGDPPPARLLPFERPLPPNGMSEDMGENLLWSIAGDDGPAGATPTRMDATVQARGHPDTSTSAASTLVDPTMQAAGMAAMMDPLDDAWLSDPAVLAGEPLSSPPVAQGATYPGLSSRSLSSPAEWEGMLLFGLEGDGPVARPW